MVRLGDWLSQPSVGNFARLCDLAMELVEAPASPGGTNAGKPTDVSPKIDLGEFKRAYR